MVSSVSLVAAVAVILVVSTFVTQHAVDLVFSLFGG
jgi:hypothetical protein